MNLNYEEFASKLARRDDVIGKEEELIPFLLQEARKRRDGEMVARLAEWFEEKEDTKQYLELAMEAAELGSPRANFWLGHEYLCGKHLPRDYEKAYYCFLKGEEVDWIPINPEENTEFEIDGEVEVTSEGLLLESNGDIGWWLFLLGKQPTRALKCGLADWYMKQGGDENRKTALKLFEESAIEGFEFAFTMLLEFYSGGKFKDVEKGRYWFLKAEEQGFDESCFADALGIESLKCRNLKKAADAGDCSAAAKLACAYLHGGSDDDVCCPRDEVQAQHYGKIACADEEGEQVLIRELDLNNIKDLKFLNDVTNG